MTFIVNKKTVLALSLSIVLFCLSVSQAKEQNQSSVIVYAAASLSHVLTDIQSDYQQRYPNSKIEIITASSGTLARQIERGANADIFLSANRKWMQYLADKEKIQPNSQIDLLTNSLTLIAPKDSSIDTIPLSKNVDLLPYLGDAPLVIGDANSVPVGIYAKESLTNLGIWSTLNGRLAYGKDVRAVLAFIERGEANLGIVYASDTLTSTAIKVVGDFPATSHSEIIYALALITNPDATAQKTTEVNQFYQYLQSEPARQRFSAAGFQPLAKQ